MAEDAVEALRAMFAGFGMADIAEWIAQQAIGGRNAEQINSDLYEQPVYQKYFPAMKALRAKGHAVSEAQYRAVEQGYRDVLSYAGLTGSVFDTPQTFTRLMESEVSARELEARVADAKMVADSADPNVKRALLDYYGIGANDLMMYALDPKGQGKDHVERLARSATLQGVARTTALNLSKQYTEALAGDPVLDNRTEADYREMLSGVSTLSQAQKRLAAVEGDTFTDENAADVVIKNDAQQTLKSKQRAAREVARFSGSSGLSTAAMRGTRGI